VQAGGGGLAVDGFQHGGGFLPLLARHQGPRMPQPGVRLQLGLGVTAPCKSCTTGDQNNWGMTEDPTLPPHEQEGRSLSHKLHAGRTHQRKKGR
jgi:hypothetical protein